MFERIPVSARIWLLGLLVFVTQGVAFGQIGLVGFWPTFALLSSLFAEVMVLLAYYFRLTREKGGLIVACEMITQVGVWGFFFVSLGNKQLVTDWMWMVGIFITIALSMLKAEYYDKIIGKGIK